MTATSNPGTSQSLDFSHGNALIEELLGRLHEIEDLNAVSALAQWDQNTAMPEGAGEVRGKQLATLQGVLHQRWTEPRLGELVSSLESESESGSFTDADRALLWHARRGYDQATKLPESLVMAIAENESGSFEAWR